MGIALTEETAKLLIERFAEKQRGGNFACPRCGRMAMNEVSVLKNALSRHINVYICDACGMQEALEDMMDCRMPLTAWAIAQAPDCWQNENIKAAKRDLSENEERRRLVVELLVDERKLAEMGTDNYLESKLAQLADDGIEVGQWTITDQDDYFAMARYVSSVFEWAFEHSNAERTSSPPTYEVWEAQAHGRQDAENCTIIKRVLYVSKNEVQHYNRLMQASSVDYDANGIERYATVNRWTMDFGEGYEMDISVCSCDQGDPLWCQAVLFHHRCEIGCSEVEAELDGTWTISHGDISFTVELRTD